MLSFAHLISLCESPQSISNFLNSECVISYKMQAQYGSDLKYRYNAQYQPKSEGARLKYKSMSEQDAH